MIAQKYIERPLLILKRKFDIRQLVLITNLNPLTIWFYDQCYVRFSSEKYDVEHLQSKLKHSSSNYIAKKQTKPEDSEIPGNMWFQHQFIDYMKQRNHGSDYFTKFIQPQMKQIVIWSLQSTSDVIENRKNSHELMGFDFMIDDSFQVWLIEVNQSPPLE